MMDRGARTFYSPLKRVSMKQGGKVICTLLSTARANRVQSCSDLVCVRKITSSTNYSLGSMSGDAICKNRYTVRSVHLSEQGCTCGCHYPCTGASFQGDANKQARTLAAGCEWRLLRIRGGRIKPLAGGASPQCRDDVHSRRPPENDAVEPCSLPSCTTSRPIRWWDSWMQR